MGTTERTTETTIEQKTIRQPLMPEQNILPSGAKLTITPATKRSTQNVKTLKQQENVRVAAYCRVSTDELDQQNSFENQSNYYKDFIKQKEGWTLCGIYSDEGISGMSTKGRHGFNRMIRDAKAGKFDYIITKSISRFSRNTVDGLSIVNELRNLDPPIGVYFEKEGLDTMQKGCEFLLSIMMSMAQGESDSIGENIQWTYRKKYSEGDPLINPDNIYGYKKGENGEWEIDEEQGDVVRRIFDLFLAGWGTQKIAHTLTADEVLTPRGKSQWNPGTVHSILGNEKYKGDVQMQKYVTVDRKSKKHRKNNGEAKTYYLENHHPAIVSRAEWDATQRIMEAKKRPSTYQHGDATHFSPKKILTCGDCGKELHVRNIDRSVSGYLDDRKKLNGFGSYYFYEKEYSCPNGHAKVFRGTFEQSFMEALYKLKRDFDKYGDTSDLATSFQKALDDAALDEKVDLDLLEINYQDFVNALESLPEKNLAGYDMKINGVDTDGSLIRTEDGKLKGTRLYDLKAGKIKITSDKIEEAPDILPFSEEIMKGFIKNGKLYNDRIVFTTTFGIEITAKNTDRKIDSFLGFRKCGNDGKIHMVLDPYEVENDKPYYRMTGNCVGKIEELEEKEEPAETTEEPNDKVAV